MANISYAVHDPLPRLGQDLPIEVPQVLLLAHRTCKSLDNPNRWFDWNKDIDADFDIYSQGSEPIHPSEKSLVERLIMTIHGRVLLSRQGMVQESQDFLSRLEVQLSRVPFFRNSRLIVESTLYSALSYTLHKLKRPVEANIAIEKAMACDEELELSYGWHFRHLHRIHMIENRMLVQMRAGSTWEGLETASFLLKYLTNTSDEVPFSGTWSPEMVRNLDPYFLEIKTLQICKHVSGALADGDPETLRMFVDACTDITTSPLSDPISAREAKFWLRAKSSAIRGDRQKFLDTCAEWFPCTAPKDIRLYADALRELRLICESSGFIALFRARIAPEVRNWEMLGDSEKLFLLDTI